MKLKVSEIKTNPDNPRVIKDSKFAKLVNSLVEFPEMAEVREVVVNKDHVILGGNMRFKAMKEAGWKEIPVRVVDWSEEKQREFVIKDNVSGGDWDWDLLANEWSLDQLDEWGLEVPVNDRIDNMEDGDEIEFEQSVQIEPPQEYVMIIAEPNSVEWEELKEKIKLKMVRRGGYKKGSAFDSVGLERVIDWKDFKDRYDSSSTE